jgi:hypothetical protein
MTPFLRNCSHIFAIAPLIGAQNDVMWLGFLKWSQWRSLRPNWFSTSWQARLGMAALSSRLFL